MAARKKAPGKQVAAKGATPKKFTDAQLKLLGDFLKMSDEELQARMPKDIGQGHPLEEGEYEARLILLNRLLLRGVSRKDCAGQLGCSISLIDKMIRQLKDNKLRQMQGMRWESYIAETLALYTELIQNAMLISSSPKASQRDKLAAIEAVARIEGQRQSFLARIGVLGSDDSAERGRATIMPRAEENTHDDDAVALEMIHYLNKSYRDGDLMGDVIDGTAQQVFDE